MITADLFAEPAVGPLASSNARVDLALAAMLRARTTDPSTSKAAAARAGAFAEDHHSRILAALEAPGTIYDIAQRTGIDHVAVARRMPELQREGKAAPTGGKQPGPTGSQCRVWKAA